MEQERVGEEGEGEQNVWWEGKASPEKKGNFRSKKKGVTKLDRQQCL